MPNLVVLQGGMGTRQRLAVAERLAEVTEKGKRVLLATGRYVGEGFDDARLDTLFLAMPISWRGILVQYAGRLHRLHSGKAEVRIYDYVDRASPVLMSMFRKRMRGYRAMGYEPVERCRKRHDRPIGFNTPRQPGAAVSSHAAVDFPALAA